MLTYISSTGVTHHLPPLHRPHVPKKSMNNPSSALAWTAFASGGCSTAATVANAETLPPWTAAGTCWLMSCVQLT
jgi:hypothetical protein